MKEKDNMIQIAHLTKDYGHGRGVFDVTIEVQKGECFGFLGPNGAGKTTTIRHLMGFSKPQQGSVFIRGKECWQNAARLKKSIGYIPGEIALPAGLTGEAFLKMMGRMQGLCGLGAGEVLAERFRLDTKTQTREMSLGDKRKLAIIAAFLHDPQILILDEPTSGLDPIMQQEFVELIREEKQRGKTIFLSSHMFHEVNAVCDRIAIIKSGRIVSQFTADEVRDGHGMIYVLEFGDERSYEAFSARGFRIVAESEERLTIKVNIGEEEMNRFVAATAEADVTSFRQLAFSLEDYFMDFYKEEKAFEEVR